MQVKNLSLDPNWVTSGLMDFEYKKYMLLDYVQKCQAAFRETRLYPPLSDLCLHYKNLQDLQTGIDALEKNFPREWSGFDTQNFTLLYTESHLKNHEMETIQEIIDFALPTVKQVIADGKGIYEAVEQHLEIQPIGLMPLYKDDGYLMIHTSSVPDVYIYRYHQSILVHHNENYRQLRVEYMTHTTLSIGHTLENIKLELIKSDQSMPQPAAFDCLCSLAVPLNETLIPVAKRAVLRHLAQID